MIATRSPRCRLRGSAAEPRTRGVPPRMSMRTTPMSAAPDPLAQPRHAPPVAARACSAELALQPGDLDLRLLQRGAQALQLGLEARQQALRLAIEAVGADLEVRHLARVAGRLPLRPPEPGARDEEQPDEQLGGLAQLPRLARHLLSDADGGARAGRGGR